MSFVAPVAAHVPHPLHGSECTWPETNCYVDLWVELLHARGLDPHAMLSFAVLQDYEGDQFTFAKPLAEDIEGLYGLAVQELSIYESLERHAVTQLRQGHMLLVEVDGFFLPDTRATSYRREHTKTTIGLEAIDPAAGRAIFFHNATRGMVEGEDYTGLFAPAAVPLPPYVERVRPRGEALPSGALRDAALGLLARDLRRRPTSSPVAAWRTELPEQLERLFDQPGLVHGYAFNLPRQIGATFHLLGRQLAWLDMSGPAPERRFEAECQACEAVSETAKALQFRILRSVTRRRPDPCAELLDTLEAAHGAALAGLAAKLA